MRVVVLAALACLAYAGSAHSAAVTVPDDFATIQAAVDSGADSVFIRAGVYHERPAVPREVALIRGLPESGVRPRIDGLHVHESCFSLRVETCSFSGGVRVDGGCGLATAQFESCDLDSGLVNEIYDTADFAIIAIRRSRIGGPVTLRGFHSACEADTFVGAGVRFTDEASGWVQHCVFSGPGDQAIQHAAYGTARIVGNTIEGFQTGISVTASDHEAFIDGNEIRACVRGMSVEADNWVRVRGNRVFDCATGIVGSGWSGRLDLHENLVLGSTYAGLSLEYDGAGTISGNVVGRCGGDGVILEIRDPYGQITLDRNTAFRNVGAGFRAIGLPTRPDALLRLSRNIGFENGSYGAHIDPMPVVSECNDWYGNAFGATEGFSPSPSDLEIDPQFCDVDGDSVTLFASSALADAPGCGRIGARGVACDAAAVPLSGRLRAITLAPVTPNPSAGAVRIRWSSPREEWVDVTIHDLAGRTIATVARSIYGAGTHDVAWEGGTIPSGVYFVRLRSGAESITRSFLVRR